MNFTREPIIETIITPKEGYKLIVRNSKGSGQEEHIVDALEVVSFGHSFFFRSLERPKSFLVPVSDYEVIEAKETRVALKAMSHERHIKIGGGREAPVRAPREAPPERAPQQSGEEERESSEETASAEGQPAGEREQPGREEKRGRRRHRRRRSGEDRRQEWSGGQRREQQQPSESQEARGSLPTEAEEGGGANDETQVSSQSFTPLIPPPRVLISETISRYKDLGFPEAGPVSKTVKKHHEQPPEEKHPKKEEESGSDAQMNRSTTFVAYETQSFATEFRSTTDPFLG